MNESFQEIDEFSISKSSFGTSFKGSREYVITGRAGKSLLVARRPAYEAWAFAVFAGFAIFLNLGKKYLPNLEHIFTYVFPLLIIIVFLTVFRKTVITVSPGRESPVVSFSLLPEGNWLLFGTSYSVTDRGGTRVGEVVLVSGIKNLTELWIAKDNSGRTQFCAKRRFFAPKKTLIDLFDGTGKNLIGRADTNFLGTKYTFYMTRDKCSGIDRRLAIGLALAMVDKLHRNNR